MLAKKHINHGRLILALVDNTLIGKKLEDKEKVLDLSSEFYNGSELPEIEIEKLLKQAYIINAVGEESTNLLVTMKIIDSAVIKTIDGVPFVIVVEG